MQKRDQFIGNKVEKLSLKVDRFSSVLDTCSEGRGEGLKAAISNLEEKSGVFERFIKTASTSLRSIKEQSEKSVKQLEHQVILTLDRVSQSLLEDNQKVVERVLNI